MGTVTILGSGTLLPDDACRSAAHLVEDGAFRLLLDCGSGTVHGMPKHGVRWQELTHVALTHFHTDHIGDLPALLWALKYGVPGGRREALTLVGPAGLLRRLEAMAEAFGEFILDPGFPVEVVELEAGARWTDRGRDLELSTHATVHTTESLAYRIRGPSGQVGYTGDTGPHAPLGSFFRGVDVLVSECALPDDDAMEIHLTPRSVTALASAARPDLLILTHLYPGVEPGPLPDLVRALGYTGDVRVGRDGMRLSVPPEPRPDPDTSGPAVQPG